MAELSDKWSLETILLFINKELYESSGAAMKYHDMVDKLPIKEGKFKFVKFMMLLEDVDMVIDSYKNAMEYEEARKDLNNAIQFTIGSKPKCELPFHDTQKFDDWLIKMIVEKGIDNEKTDDTTETLEMLKDLTVTHIKCRSKKVYGIHDAHLKRTQSTHKSDLAGITDEDRRMWVEMLLVIPGLSEEKAISIQRQHKNLKSLMDLYASCANDTARENILADLPVQSKNQDKLSKLGKALSKKIFLTFWSTDYNASI